MSFKSMFDDVIVEAIDEVREEDGGKVSIMSKYIADNMRNICKLGIKIEAASLLVLVVGLVAYFILFNMEMLPKILLGALIAVLYYVVINKFLLVKIVYFVWMNKASAYANESIKKESEK